MSTNAKTKPGPKAGGAYGMGLPAGTTRRQLTITLPTTLLVRLNDVAQRTHQQRSALITLAVQRLIEGDDPSFGKRRK